MVSQNLFGGVTAELIKLQVGGVTGAPGVRSALDEVKKLWTYECQDLIDQKFTTLNVPYSNVAHFHMFDHFKDKLRHSRPGSIELGAPWVRYAGFVDAMNPPIHWTGGGNRYHWFQRVSRFFETIKSPALRKAIRQARLSGITSKSVGQLATEMAPE